MDSSCKCHTYILVSEIRLIGTETRQRCLLWMGKWWWWCWTSWIGKWCSVRRCPESGSLSVSVWGPGTRNRGSAEPGPANQTGIVYWVATYSADGCCSTAECCAPGGLRTHRGSNRSRLMWRRLCPAVGFYA